MNNFFQRRSRRISSGTQYQAATGTTQATDRTATGAATTTESEEDWIHQACDGHAVDHSQRSRGVVYGGVALLHRLADEVGLVKVINGNLNLLKFWLPCQVVEQGRRTLLRVFSWNEHPPTFFRLCTVLRC